MTDFRRELLLGINATEAALTLPHLEDGLSTFAPSPVIVLRLVAAALTSVVGFPDTRLESLVSLLILDPNLLLLTNDLSLPVKAPPAESTDVRLPLTLLALLFEALLVVVVAVPVTATELLRLLFATTDFRLGVAMLAARWRGLSLVSSTDFLLPVAAASLLTFLTFMLARLNFEFFNVEEDDGTIAILADLALPGFIAPIAFFIDIVETVLRRDVSDLIVLAFALARHNLVTPLLRLVFFKSSAAAAFIVSLGFLLFGIFFLNSVDALDSARA